jgi:hypothetical protein
VGNGGCLEGFVFEGVDCAADSDCGCPHHCRADPGLGIDRCVESCETSADCSLDDDHCAGGLCLTNFCAADLLGNLAPGRYAQPCDALGSGDGNCLAVGFEGSENFSGEFEYGLCLRGGGATDSCPGPLQNQAGGIASFALVTFAQEIGLPRVASELCPAGAICAVVDGGTGCVPLCDPLLDGGGLCASGACLEQGGDPIVDLGACLACVADGGNCALDTDCCSGRCGGSLCQ